MKLDFALLSNWSELQGGLLYVTGGGWDTGWRASYPAPFQGALTIRLLSHPTETSSAHQLELRFLSEDGAEFAPRFNLTIAANPAPADWPKGWDVPLIFAIGLQALPIPAPGHYSIEVLVDNSHLRSVQFRMNKGGPPPAA